MPSRLTVTALAGAAALASMLPIVWAVVVAAAQMNNVWSGLGVRVELPGALIYLAGVAVAIRRFVRRARGDDAAFSSMELIAIGAGFAGGALIEFPGRGTAHGFPPGFFSIGPVAWLAATYVLGRLQVSK